MIYKYNKKILIFIIVSILAIICYQIICHNLHKTIIDDENNIKFTYVNKDKIYNLEKFNIIELTDSENKKYVTYEQFYDEKNDGNDDYYSFARAHYYANEHHCEVKATKKIYNIYKNNNELITIKTNTDWNNAKIYIHDENISYEAMSSSIFKVTNPTNFHIIDDKEKLKKIQIKKDTKKISELSGNGNAICIAFNSQKKQFNRNGEEKTGRIQEEIFKIDNDGNVISNIEWDFENIDRIYISEISESKLQIKNANFITILSGKEEKTYFKRNIWCEGSNISFENINHYLDDDEKLGGAYEGFLSVDNSAHIMFTNCSFTAHKYKNFSCYDLNLEACYDINFENVIQNNDINDITKWGIIKTSYCKYVSFVRCSLNRIDAHNGIYNLSINNCTVGSQGICVTGGGNLNIEGTKCFDCRSFIFLRNDYGSFWDGNIKINNSEYCNNGETGFVINTINNEDNKNYGYDLILPNVEIDDLKTNSSKNYLFKGDYDLTNTYVLPKKISLNCENIIIPFQKFYQGYDKIQFNNEKINVMLEKINSLNNEIANSNKIKNDFKTEEKIKNEIVNEMNNIMFEYNDNVENLINKECMYVYEKINQLNENYIYDKNDDIQIRIEKIFYNLSEILEYTDDGKNINYYEELKEKINNLINRYDDNIDIDISNFQDSVEKLKGNFQSSEEDNKENFIYIKKSELLIELLNREIKKVADKEFHMIKYNFDHDLNKPTNSDIKLKIITPANGKTIIDNYENIIIFKNNKRISIEFNIRDFNYNKEIIINNIDRAKPEINNINSFINEIVEPTFYDKCGINKVILRKDELDVEYKIGERIEEPGLYSIKVIDNAGNSNQKNFVIFDKMKANDGKDIKFIGIENVNSNCLKYSDFFNYEKIKILDTDNKNKKVQDNIITGDKIMEDGQTYKIIIYGDCNKNGRIDISDLIIMRNLITNESKCDEEMKKISDISHDNKVSIIDLIKERKRIVDLED